MKTIIDAKTIPAELRGGVERAARILEDQLTAISDFDVEARWRCEPGSAGRNAVLLDLVYRSASEVVQAADYNYDSRLFQLDDSGIQQRFSNQILRFADEMSAANRRDLLRLQNRLEAMPAIGEN